MNNQAGKGSQLRKGANLNRYWDNYDAIFKKPYILPKDSLIKQVYQDGEEVMFFDDNDIIVPWPDDLHDIPDVSKFCKVNNLKII